MIYFCGHSKIIYLSTEEYFSLSDEELEYIINRYCFDAVDPLHFNSKNVRYDDMYTGDTEEDIPKPKMTMNEMIELLDSLEFDESSNMRFFEDFDSTDDDDDYGYSED